MILQNYKIDIISDLDDLVFIILGPLRWLTLITTIHFKITIGYYRPIILRTQS